MNKLYEIYYIGISDFLDRIRSKSTLIMSLLIIYVSYLFFPQSNSSFYYTLNYTFGNYFYRGIYNSMWVGWVATVAFISIVTLVGFYFIRNSIKRERDLLVGEISASTGIKSWIFIFGKAFGNLLFLLFQMLIVILVTIIMQFVRGESYSLHLIKLLTPFLLLAVPACFITAIIAIIFEIIPFLKSTFGNIVYFSAWCAIVIFSFTNKSSLFSDVFGLNAISKIISQQLKANFKEFANVNSFNIGSSGPLHGNIKTFVMDKVNIGSNVFFERLFWILIGILLLFLVSTFFKRTSLIRKKAPKSINTIIKPKGYTPSKNTTLSDIFENKAYSNSFSILKSNLKIILSSLNLYWYGALIACFIGVLFAKGDALNKFLIPLIWILPIVVWSKLGSIQRDFNMESYLLTYKNYRNGEPLNSAIAGILFTLLINASIIIKFLAMNNLLGVLYILMAIFFVNAFGIFTGSFFKSSTFFEMIYIILWYVGILNGLPTLDFLGITTKSASYHIPVIFLVIGGILMIASIIIRNARTRIKTH